MSEEQSRELRSFGCEDVRQVSRKATKRGKLSSNIRMYQCLRRFTVLVAILGACRSDSSSNFALLDVVAVLPLLPPPTLVSHIMSFLSRGSAPAPTADVTARKEQVMNEVTAPSSCFNLSTRSEPPLDATQVRSQLALANAQELINVRSLPRELVGGLRLTPSPYRK